MSGWAGRQPVARSMPAPDSATTNPWPPCLTRVAKTAIVMSASPARTGSVSGAGGGGGLAEVAVEEQQVTRVRTAVARLQQPYRLRAALHRRGLAAAAGVAHHGRPGLLRHGGGAVPGAVVHHQHEIHPGQPGGAGHGRRDAVGLVPGGDDDSHVTARHHGLILGLAEPASGRRTAAA